MPQARDERPANRNQGREDATGDYRRAQDEANRLEQGAAQVERDLQVVPGVQANPRVRHELRHGQVVQELPPVLPPVPRVRASHLRPPHLSPVRLQWMRE